MGRIYRGTMDLGMKNIEDVKMVEIIANPEKLSWYTGRIGQVFFVTDFEPNESKYIVVMLEHYHHGDQIYNIVMSSKTIQKKDCAVISQITPERDIERKFKKQR